MSVASARNDAAAVDSSAVQIQITTPTHAASNAAAPPASAGTSATAFTALPGGSTPVRHHSRSNSTLPGGLGEDGSAAPPPLSASQDIQRHLLKQQQQRQQQMQQAQATPDRTAHTRSQTAVHAPHAHHAHHHHPVHIHGHGQTPPPTVAAKPSLSRMGSLDRSGAAGATGGPPTFTRTTSLDKSTHHTHHAATTLLVDPRASLLSSASLSELQFLNSSLLQELQYYDVLTRELSSELECSLDHITQLQAEVKASHTTLEELAVSTEVLRKECVRAEQTTAQQVEKSWHAERRSQDEIKKLKHALRSVGINPNHVLAGTADIGSIAHHHATSSATAARTSDDEREHRINMDSNASTITSSTAATMLGPEGAAASAAARKEQRKQKREARRRRLMLAEDQSTNVQIESEGSSGPESLDEDDGSTDSDTEAQRRRDRAAKVAAAAGIQMQPESNVLSAAGAVSSAVSFATANPAAAPATGTSPPSGFVPESALHSLQESHDLLLDRHRKLELRLINQQKSWADYLAMVQSKASMAVRRVTEGTQTEMVLNTPSAAFLSDYASEKLVFVTPNIWKAVRKAHQHQAVSEAERGKQQQRKEPEEAGTTTASSDAGTGSGAESARFIYSVDPGASSDVPRSRLHRRTSSQPDASYASSSSLGSIASSPISLAAPSGLSSAGPSQPAAPSLQRNLSNASSGLSSPTNAPLSASRDSLGSSTSSLPLFSPSQFNAAPSSSTMPVASDGSSNGSSIGSAGVDLVPTRSLPSVLSSEAEFGRSSAFSAESAAIATDASFSARPPPQQPTSSFVSLPEFDASGIIRTPLPLSVVAASGSQPTSPSNAASTAAGSAPPSSTSRAHAPQFLFNTNPMMMSPSRGPSANPLISRHVAPPSLHPQLHPHSATPSPPQSSRPHSATPPPSSAAARHGSPSPSNAVGSAWTVMAPVGVAPRVRVNAGPPVMHHSAVSVPMAAGQPQQPLSSPPRSSVSPTHAAAGSSPPSSSTNKYLEMAAQASAKRKADAAAAATTTAATDATNAPHPQP